MKRKNAFTLVEMLAVIVVLGLIMIVAFPKILEMVTRQEDEVDKAKEKMIASAVESYLNANKNTYPAREGKNYCINLFELDNKGFLALDSEELDLDQKVLVTYTSDNKYTIDLETGSCDVQSPSNDLAGLSCAIDKQGYAIKKTVTISYPLSNGDTRSYCYSTNGGTTWTKVDKFDTQASGKGVKKLDFSNNANVIAKIVLGTSCGVASEEDATCTATISDIDSKAIGTIVTYEANKIDKGYIATDGSLVARSKYQELYDVLDFSAAGMKQPPNSREFYLPKQEGKMIKYQ